MYNIHYCSFCGQRRFLWQCVRIVNGEKQKWFSCYACDNKKCCDSSYALKTRMEKKDSGVKIELHKIGDDNDG